MFRGPNDMRPPRFRTLLCACGAFVACACSSTSDEVFCGGVTNPTVLTLDSVTPALGATVPNDEIVHSFSVLNDIVFQDIALEELPSHTAGDPSSAITFGYTVAAESTDLAAADPVDWSYAPGHVELDAPIIYQTDDGCAYKLPSPLFSYDVTPPDGSEPSAGGAPSIE